MWAPYLQSRELLDILIIVYYQYCLLLKIAVHNAECGRRGILKILEDQGQDLERIGSVMLLS